MSEKKALIMVDLQNDFCRNGKLEVPDGDSVIQLANLLQPYFDLVVATQDWHPKDHMSFANNHPGYSVGNKIPYEGGLQELWPEHGVQQTQGAAFHPELDLSRIDKVFQKGTQKEIDSYSAFFDNAHKRSTGLADYLKAANIADVYLLGLATDYCVKFSALDAAQLGFNVYLIEDACRGVELKPGDIAGALEEMMNVGVHVIHSSDLL